MLHYLSRVLWCNWFVMFILMYFICLCCKIVEYWIIWHIINISNEWHCTYSMYTISSWSIYTACYQNQGSHYLLILKFQDFSRTFKDPQISFSRTNSRRKFTAWAEEQQYLMLMYVTMVQLLRKKTYYLANVDASNIRGRLKVHLNKKLDDNNVQLQTIYSIYTCGSLACLFIHCWAATACLVAVVQLHSTLLLSL